MMLEPSPDSCEKIHGAKSAGNEDLNVAMNEQLKISPQSSELIAETENFLATLKSQVSSGADSLKPDDIPLHKDNNVGILNDAHKSSVDGCGSKKEQTSTNAPNNDQSEEFNLFSDESTSSNIEQDQEESSMWQKCPVITFQTFDDLTGLLISRLSCTFDRIK
jgi:hypothetical protein